MVHKTLDPRSILEHWCVFFFFRTSSQLSPSTVSQLANNCTIIANQIINSKFTSEYRNNIKNTETTFNMTSTKNIFLLSFSNLFYLQLRP